MPFSFLYGIITSVRNFCFDIGIFKTYSPSIRSICVGNLSVGGTGKTPVVDYIAQLLSPFHKTVILSRGYGRKSNGFRIVQPESDVNDSGDEPLMYAQKFRDKLQVAVCENRVEGIHKLLGLESKPELVILDDAFQHRAICAELNILLTEFNHPYFNDYLLPSGRLRESENGAKRAQILVVSKCPQLLSEQQKKEFIEKSGFEPSKVFFSWFQYQPMQAVGKAVEHPDHAIVITGIGNPKPLIAYTEKLFSTTHMAFADHHSYSRANVLKIHELFGKFAHKEAILLTTEKDWMRLKSVLSQDEIKNFPWHIQPVTVLFDRQDDFNQEIKKYARTI